MSDSSQMVSAMDSYTFTGRELLSLLLEEFPESYVEQTGGGTATFYIRKTESADIMTAAGPGVFNWADPDGSEFVITDFSIGIDQWYPCGQHDREDELNVHIPESMQTERPDLEGVARLIRETYATINNGVFPVQCEECSEGGTSE